MQQNNFCRTYYSLFTDKTILHTTDAIIKRSSIETRDSWGHPLVEKNNFLKVSDVRFPFKLWLTTVTWLRSSQGNIRDRTVRGAVWVFLAKGGSQLLSILKLAILARFLTREDFGLMAIAMFMMNLLETFTEPGLKAALIQRQGDIRPYLDTTFTLQVIRAFSVAGLIFFAAPYAALFFSAAEATPIIRAAGLLLLIQAMTNPATVEFQRRMNFQKVFYWDLVGVIVGFSTAILLAFYYRNVWALVLSAAAAEAARAVVSYRIDPYRPRLAIDLSKIKDLAAFGKWIVGARILSFSFLSLDKAVVGKLLGPAKLGLYHLAFGLSGYALTEISRVLATVLFPAFSEIKDNKSLLRNTYFKSLKLTVCLGLAATMTLFLFSEMIVSLVFGPGWEDMVAPLRILAIFAFFRSLSVVTVAFLNGVGLPRVSTNTTLISLVVLAIVIVPLTVNLGVVGTSWALVISAVPATGLQFASVAKALRLEK